MSKSEGINVWYVVHRIGDGGKRTPVAQSRVWSCVRKLALGVMLRDGDCEIEVRQCDDPPYHGIKVVHSSCTG